MSIITSLLYQIIEEFINISYALSHTEIKFKESYHLMFHHRLQKTSYK